MRDPGGGGRGPHVAGAVQLTFDPYTHDQVPDWSPDGSKIAYEDDATGGGDIYVMNANGSNQTRNVYVINADGTGLYRVSPSKGNQYPPAWQPLGAGS